MYEPSHINLRSFFFEWSGLAGVDDDDFIDELLEAGFSDLPSFCGMIAVLMTVLGSFLSIFMRRVTSGGRDPGHVDKIIMGEGSGCCGGASSKSLRFVHGWWLEGTSLFISHRYRPTALCPPPIPLDSRACIQCS